MSCEDYYPDWGHPIEPSHDAPYRLEFFGVGDGTKIVTVWNDLIGKKVDEYRIYAVTLAEEDNPWNECVSRKKKEGDKNGHND
jgi:hypothetical protein